MLQGKVAWRHCVPVSTCLATLLDSWGWLCAERGVFALHRFYLSDKQALNHTQRNEQKFRPIAALRGWWHPQRPMRVLLALRCPKGRRTKRCFRAAESSFVCKLCTLGCRPRASTMGEEVTAFTVPNGTASGLSCHNGDQ